MLDRVTKRELEALATLKNNFEFQIVIEWLTKSRGVLDGILRTSDQVVVLHRAQGANQVLTELIDLHATAQQILSKGTK